MGRSVSPSLTVLALWDGWEGEVGSSLAFRLVLQSDLSQDEVPSVFVAPQLKGVMTKCTRSVL